MGEDPLPIECHTFPQLPPAAAGPLIPASHSDSEGYSSSPQPSPQMDELQ